MDPNDVSRLVEELKLSTDAGEAVITIKEEEIRKGGWEGGTNFDRFVVGKIFATRVVNRETLKIQLPKILQTRGVPDIEIVGDNLFVIAFTNDRDRQHALVDGPWHFFDNLMMFKEPQGMEKPTDVKFDIFSTWIQCHNLPLICMNPGMIRRIAEQVGQVEEIDVGDGGNCLGQYARARISRDVNKPLQRCVSINTGIDKEKHIILIRYERLPEYCSACGRVGHNVRHCNDNLADKQKRPFGVWLKATRTLEARRGRGDGTRMRGMHGMEESMTGASSYREEREEEKKAMIQMRKEGDESEEESGETLGSGGRNMLKGGEMRKEVGGVSRGEGEGDEMVVGEKDGGVNSSFMDEEETEEREVFGLESEERETLQGFKERAVKISPKKKKKGSGKEWKRLARTVKRGGKGEEGEGGDDENKRAGKRKGAQVFDTEDLAHKRKCSRVESEWNDMGEPTAEAALQPRRSQ